MAKEEKKISFYSQGKGMDCFPVALMNACAWRRVKIPNRKKLIKAAGCEYGATISYDKAIALCSLDFEETINEEVLKRGEGILTIMHPEYNLHSCFCTIFHIPVGGRCLVPGILLVNSLLCSNVKCLVSRENIPFPKHEHQNRGWIIKE